MQKTFKIFLFDENKDERINMCEFINGLNKNKRKFTITKWDNQDMTEKGFIVWYYY